MNCRVDRKAGGEIGRFEVVEDPMVVEEQRQMTGMAMGERRRLGGHDHVVAARVEPVERLDACQVAEELGLDAPFVRRDRHTEWTVGSAFTSTVSRVTS